MRQFSILLIPFILILLKAKFTNAQYIGEIPEDTTVRCNTDQGCKEQNTRCHKVLSKSEGIYIKKTCKQACKKSRAIMPETKVPCDGDQECFADNEKCHEVIGPFSKKGFCGPKSCKNIDDCANIGNIDQGIMMAEDCKNDECIYSKGVAIA